MSKFLDLINENQPGSSSSNILDDGTIQKLRDAGVDIKKTEKGVAITFYIGEDIPDEEAEDPYTSRLAVDTTVQNMADRTGLLGGVVDSNSRAAKGAVRERKTLEPQIVQLYKNTTAKLKKQYDNLLKQVNTTTTKTV